MDSLKVLVAQHNLELETEKTEIKSFWLWLDNQCNTCGFASGKEVEWELEAIASEFTEE